MGFNVVCTLIDITTRNHSGQNVVDSRGAELELKKALRDTFVLLSTTVN